jgi:hypothetical protein
MSRVDDGDDDGNSDDFNVSGNVELVDGVVQKSLKEERSVDPIDDRC